MHAHIWINKQIDLTDPTWLAAQRGHGVWINKYIRHGRYVGMCRDMFGIDNYIPVWQSSSSQELNSKLIGIYQIQTIQLTALSPDINSMDIIQTQILGGLKPVNKDNLITGCAVPCQYQFRVMMSWIHLQFKLRHWLSSYATDNTNMVFPFYINVCMTYQIIK